MKIIVLAAMLVNSFALSHLAAAADKGINLVKAEHVAKIESFSNSCLPTFPKPDFIGTGSDDAGYSFHISDLPHYPITDSSCISTVKIKLGKGYQIRAQRVNVAGSYARVVGKRGHVVVTSTFDANSIPTMKMDIPNKDSFFQKTVRDLPENFSPCSDGTKDLTLKIDVKAEGEVPAQLGTMLYVFDVKKCKV